MDKEEIWNQLKEVGVERVEFDANWAQAQQQGVELKVSDMDEYIKTNIRRYYRKLLNTPTQLFEKHAFIGATKLTDWAQIHRGTYKKKFPNAKPEEAVYLSGYSKGEPIPEHDFAKSFYFMDDKGQLLTISAKGTAAKREEKLVFGNQYNFRLVVKTTKQGAAYYTPASYTKFVQTGVLGVDEVKKRLRLFSLADIPNTPELPELFLLEVDVVDVMKGSYEDKVLIEDKSIETDFTASYSVTFEQNGFKAPENAHALIVVKPIYAGGKLNGFEGLAYHSNDTVQPDNFTEEEWKGGKKEAQG